MLKVTLDALCGPAGVLINDCQVQSVVCRWIDWTRSDQRVSIGIRFMRDEWLLKDGLRFVRIQGPLCFPLNRGLPASVALDTLEHIQQLFQLRSAAQSGDWYAGQHLMPVQQLFHVGRLRGFVVVSAAELREELGRATQGGVQPSAAPDG